MIYFIKVSTRVARDPVDQISLQGFIRSHPALSGITSCFLYGFTLIVLWMLSLAGSRPSADRQGVMKEVSVMETMFLLENVSDPIIIVDNNFHVISANPSFYECFGTDRRSVSGKKSCDLFKELDFSQCNDACGRVVERAVEGKKVAAPNDHCPQFDCAYPIIDRQGKLQEIILILKNVTRERRAAAAGGAGSGEEIKKSTFSTICHDLASPLQVIRACADVMALELEGSDEAKSKSMREMLDATRRNERRLAEMVRTIRLIPLLEEEEIYHPERVRPVTAADCTCSDFRLLLRSDETLEWYLPKDIPEIMIDPGLLNRIFFNLLDNARRYVHPGDRIVVSAQYDRDREQVVFTVFDDGDAISPDILPRLFDKNVTVDLAKGEASSRRDHGWGLYFCRLAVERFGGSISVESREGWGTQFSFTVPVADPMITVARSPLHPVRESSPAA